MMGRVLVQHDVEAQPEGQDEEGVPGEEEDEAPHHLVEHRHVDVVAETSGEDRVGYIFIFPFPPIFGPVAYDGGPLSPLLRFYSICSHSIHVQPLNGTVIHSSANRGPSCNFYKKKTS